MDAMRKLRVPQPDAMIFKMLAGTWMTDRKVARLLHCKSNEAYDRVKEIACGQNLYPMRIEEGEDGGWVIVLRPNAKATVLKFVSILPE
jgi:hypothetical protein